MRVRRIAYGGVLALTVLALSGLYCHLGGVTGLPAAAAASEDRSAATPGEARKNIEYNKSVQLTPEQEALRGRALTPLPAPCCSGFSMATCCCQCNLARSIWGVSKVAASRAGATEETVRDSVLAWISAINPPGYTGDVCATGGCGRPFSEGGCGGMNENELILP